MKRSATRNENILAEIERIEKLATKHLEQGGNPDNVWRNRVDQLKALLEPEATKEIERDGTVRLSK